MTKISPPTRTSACREEDGGALVETALVMPLFLLMVFGIVQFSIVMFGYGSASYASRTAARYASLHSSTSLAPATERSVVTMVTPYLWMGSKSQQSVSVTWSPDNTVGSSVSVSVAITYNVTLPFSSLRQIAIGSTAQRLIIR